MKVINVLAMSRIILVLILFISLGTAHAQDMVYLSNEPVQQGKVLDKGSKFITFKSFAGTDTAPVSIDKSKLLLIVYEDGTFDVYPESTASGSNQKEITSTVASRTTDWIITRKNILQVNIAHSAPDVITYSDAANAGGQPATIQKAEVLAVFYKNGRFNFYTAAAEIAAALRSNLNKASSVNNKRNDSEKESGEGKPLQANQEEFSKRALDNVALLQNYLNLICRKDIKKDAIKIAIDETCELFVDGAQIEVSRIGSTDKFRNPVREYLKRLSMLPYDKVEILWYAVNYVSKWRRDGDKYWATIAFQQEFTAYQDGQVKFRELVKRDMEVLVQTYIKIDNKTGEMVQKLEVLFGDMRVKEIAGK